MYYKFTSETCAYWGTRTIMDPALCEAAGNYVDPTIRDNAEKLNPDDDDGVAEGDVFAATSEDSVPAGCFFDPTTQVAEHVDGLTTNPKRLRINNNTAAAADCASDKVCLCEMDIAMTH